ncbi:ion transporter [Bacillus sp. CGMCC 1.16541]|uniref:ion transporter n=1 Tax=Bacillus sp. CGMCC 1.16541 TaxID=2185143 RepID=UPI000D7288FF|nr:ion transporter [Bacillus sp. CGMCC 1.16541]
MTTIYSYCRKLVAHRRFTQVVLTLIILNAILVGLETYPSLYTSYANIFHYADRILLWVFTIEIVIRLFAEKPMYRFFKSSWNWFDFLIVLSGHLFAGAYFITLLRVLRVLRVLRAISVIPSLRKLVDALLMTIPAMGNILFLMGIFFYIFGVSGTMLFANTAPEYFGNLQLSLLTLFQVVTLESWASGVMRPIFAVHPWSWIYFVLFILIGTFIIINLFIGVIVNNMEKANFDDEESDEAKMQKEMAAMREEMAELKQLIKEMNSKS